MFRSAQNLQNADWHQPAGRPPQARVVAVENFFDTAELLEANLMHTPFTTILRAQRLCQQWKSVVDRCPGLQKVLFKITTQWIEATTSTTKLGLQLKGSRKMMRHSDRIDRCILRVISSDDLDGVTTKIKSCELHPAFCKIVSMWQEQRNPASGTVKSTSSSNQS